jgi:malate dehydrogenase
VIDARGASSATSAAKAALDTVRAVENKTLDGDCFSAAIVSDGSYGIDEGLVAGFPLISDGAGKVDILRDFSLSEFAKQKIQISINELKSEKEAIKELLN